MSSDGLIQFIESNFDDLMDKFIEKYWQEWEDFTYDEYEGSQQEPNFDDDIERRKLDETKI